MHLQALDPSRQHRPAYLALVLMYLSQGLPSGLAFSALGSLIRQDGHNVADVGLVGLAFLPWALKFLWAGPLENLCAPWSLGVVIAATQAFAVATCLLLAAVSPATDLSTVILLVVVLNTSCATQDIATNAYAVGRLQGRRAGAANAIQVAAFVSGMLLGGGGLLIVHDGLGWNTTMLLLAAVMAAIYLPLLLDRRWLQLPAVRPAEPGQRAGLRGLLRHPDLVAALLVALLFKFGSTAVSTLAQPWLIDRGLSLAQSGRLQITMLVMSAVGGLLIGIPLVRVAGSRRAVQLACVGAAAMLGTAFALQTLQVDVTWVYFAAFGLQSLFEGAMYVSVWSLFMNWASPHQPGTDYTVMQSCESLANACAAGVIGSLAQRWGYGEAFGYTWVAGLCAAALIFFLVPRFRLTTDMPISGHAPTDQHPPSSLPTEEPNTAMADFP